MSGHKRRRSPDPVGRPRRVNAEKAEAKWKRNTLFNNNMGVSFSHAHGELYEIVKTSEQVSDFLSSVYTRHLLKDDGPLDALIAAIEASFRVKRHILQRIIPFLHKERPDIPQDMLDNRGYPYFESESSDDMEERHVLGPRRPVPQPQQ